MYKQLIDATNPEFRDAWVLATLKSFQRKNQSLTLLDVGAGLSPYKNSAIELGFDYLSQDFGEYVPAKSTGLGGLLNPSWDYPHHDFICDILDLPVQLRVDVVLCTEVFEHIPDPIRAFEKLSTALLAEGIVIITVPFSSLMHQAPFWFQAGLSPFWFEFWAREFGLEILELSIYGDYVDQMTLEITRLFPFLARFPGAKRALVWCAKKYRRTLSQEVLSAGGHGVLFVGKKSSY
jgi:SAM-dependent methyltransferase